MPLVYGPQLGAKHRTLSINKPKHKGMLGWMCLAPRKARWSTLYSGPREVVSQF